MTDFDSIHTFKTEVYHLLILIAVKTLDNKVYMLNLKLDLQEIFCDLYP